MTGVCSACGHTLKPSDTGLSSCYSCECPSEHRMLEAPNPVEVDIQSHLKLLRAELRRRYAMAALTGLLANVRLATENESVMVSMSWAYADKMMKQEKL